MIEIGIICLSETDPADFRGTFDVVKVPLPKPVNQRRNTPAALAAEEFSSFLGNNLLPFNQISAMSAEILNRSGRPC
ncbi:MAG TPA: hypothetical protein PLJ29_07515, partial [Leptospiraceae bacterium]|nr:hypothetical protein [Leptospiraceae bacterium]